VKEIHTAEIAEIAENFGSITDVPPYQKEKMIFGGGLERFTGNM